MEIENWKLKIENCELEVRGWESGALYIYDESIQRD